MNKEKQKQKPKLKTINISESLLAELKEHCNLRGFKIYKFVEIAIKQALRDG